jgi:hypothetical protein
MLCGIIEGTVVSGNQGIACFQSRKAAEIPVGCPELGYAMLQANCGDASVMCFWSNNTAIDSELPHLIPVLSGFGEQSKAR